MNKFKKAEDPKSNLILTVLSYVDVEKPTYCIFENVRGFLSYNLNATQAGIHRVEGGIHMGGLKFVVRALVDMKWVSVSNLSRICSTITLYQLSGSFRASSGCPLRPSTVQSTILPNCRQTRQSSPKSSPAHS